MAGLLGFFDDEDEDEKRANFNLTVPEWARSVEKYYRREKDGGSNTKSDSNPADERRQEPGYERAKAIQ